MPNDVKHAKSADALAKARRLVDISATIGKLCAEFDIVAHDGSSGMASSASQTTIAAFTEERILIQATAIVKFADMDMQDTPAPDGA